MTDTHLYGPWDEQFAQHRDKTFLQLADELLQHDIDFVVNTGDLCSGGSNIGWHQRFKRLTDQWSQSSGKPYYVVRGNHDAAGITDQEFNEVYGSGNWWFEHKRVVMMGIDRYADWHSYAGAYYAIGPSTLDWVEQQLEQIDRDMPIVMMIHDNPIGISDFHGGETLLAKFQNHRLAQILVGHTQGNWVTRCGGVPQAVVTGETQAFDCSPTTYNIVTCTDHGQVLCDFYPYRLNTPTPPAPTTIQSGGTIRVGEDWAEQRGANGTRLTSGTLPIETPRLCWTAGFDGEFGTGGPTLLDGQLVVGLKSKGRFEQCVVAAMRPETGERLWQTQVDGSVEGGVRLHADRAYAATSAGSLYCLDRADGSVVWQWSNRTNVPIICEPVLDEEAMVLHFGGNSEVYAVDARTGKQVWRRLAVDSSIKYFSGGAASPILFEDRVIHSRPTTFDTQSVLQSFRKADGGSAKYYKPSQCERIFKRHASPIRVHGQVISVGRGVRMVPPHGFEVAVEVASPSTGATPASDALGLYVSHHNGLARYDLQSELRERWFVDYKPALLHYSGTDNWLSFDGCCPPSGNYAAPITDGTSVLVANTAGTLMCVDARNGCLHWAIQLGAPVTAAPTVSGNAMFVGDFDGQLHAYTW